jgi:hypothetical protein
MRIDDVLFAAAHAHLLVHGHNNICLCESRESWINAAAPAESARSQPPASMMKPSQPSEKQTALEYLGAAGQAPHSHQVNISQTQAAKH